MLWKHPELGRRKGVVRREAVNDCTYTGQEKPIGKVAQELSEETGEQARETWGSTFQARGQL